MTHRLAQRVLFLLLCCTCGLAAAGQYTRHVVVFKDKNNSPYRFDRPRQFLSQKAVQRRVRFSIPIDSTDLPVNPAYISQVLAQGSVSYISQAKWLNQILINTSSNAAITAIRNLPFVASVNPVGPGSGQLSATPRKFDETLLPPHRNGSRANSTAANRYNYGNSFNQIHIHNGEFLHNRGFTGSGVTIAVIDAGFYRYKTTKAFDSARARNRILGERDFVDLDGSVNEDNDHGELCLSAIAANVPGVMVGSAPDASFWLLRSENVFTEYPVEEHNWAVAAAFADSAGVDMISSSVGYMQFDDPQFNHTYNDFYKNSTTVSRAAAYAAKKGIIVTNSAGNEGSNSWKYIIFPADADSVCAVAATDANKNIASFSSFGYPGKVKPNIASVGLGTALYAYYGPTSGSGTSFSNPNINGLIACLWQAFPKVNNMGILQAVYQSADRYATPDNRFGYGIPNMRKAFQILRSAENKELCGDEWLMVSNPNFTHRLSFTLVGQTDGKATVKLLDGAQEVAATMEFNVETAEVYTKAFEGIDDLPAGDYTLQYSDGSRVTTVNLVKYVETENQRQWYKLPSAAY